MKTVRPSHSCLMYHQFFAFFKLIAHDANSSVKCFVNVSSLIGDILCFFPNQTKQSGPTRPNLVQLVNYVFKKCQDNGNALDDTEKESVQYGMDQWRSLSQ